jgi:hypothetical protein
MRVMVTIELGTRQVEKCLFVTMVTSDCYQKTSGSPHCSTSDRSAENEPMITDSIGTRPKIRAPGLLKATGMLVGRRRKFVDYSEHVPLSCSCSETRTFADLVEITAVGFFRLRTRSGRCAAEPHRAGTPVLAIPRVPEWARSIPKSLTEVVKNRM